jgi:hypothetical protein
VPFALLLCLGVALDSAEAVRAPRGQLVDLEPAWTGVAAGVGGAGGTLAGIGTLIVINTFAAPGGVVTELVGQLGLFVPMAGAAFGALAATSLFLAPGDAWIVGTAAMSGALTAGAVVLVGASFVSVLAARNGEAPDPAVALVVAGVAATLAAAAVAVPVGIVLDESAP